MGDYRENVERAIANLERVATDRTRPPIGLYNAEPLVEGGTRRAWTELETLVVELRVSWKEYCEARARGHA
mgnify:FL=1